MTITGADQPAPHALSVDEALTSVEARRDGLTADEAARRLDEHGPNRLPEAERDPWWRRLGPHFAYVLILILIVAAAITALLGHWLDAGVIAAVVVINAAIGYVQEGRAEAALEGIRGLLSLHADVRRDGEWRDIDADDLVPGDVVRLRSGDRVPADLRVIEATNLRVEESALTGESLAVDKHTGAVDDRAGIGDRLSMAFSGTLVVSGRGVGVVTATGADTEIGRINTMIGEVETIATPLTRQITAFGKQLSVAIVGFAVLVVALGLLLHDYTLDELFFASIGFAVAAIPEGLPAILTITLAIGVQRMAHRNAITRKLNAVETLGSVTVICSDKTGTLTRNEMTARRVVTGAGTYEVDGTGYAPDGDVRIDGEVVTVGDRDDLAALAEVMAWCNDSAIRRDDEGAWTLQGEPTEGALRTLAAKAGLDGDVDRLADVPFESEHKLMATLDALDGGRRVHVKGAPDQVLDRCADQIGPGGEVEPLDRARWDDVVDALGAEGMRVLAAARAAAPHDDDRLALADLDAGLVLVGVVGIIDPPRPEAIDAIATSHRAGIRVKMITGDHAGTALAIAREMGIVDDDAGALTGSDLEVASDDELEAHALEYDVFARTSPEHKLRLVRALQARGEVVAMTGDGVNDAPALKRADVGVAMGIKGTEATKEAADIVLADDNFASIESAVAEGRTIYDNLRKAILFILPTNAAEALVIVAAVVLGLSIPLTPTQILWVNMVTAVTLALALAFEPSEPGLMRRPPRATGGSILDLYFLWRIAFVGVLIGGATLAVFATVYDDGAGDEARAQTMAVGTLVVAQAFYLFNSRFLREPSTRISLLFTNRAAWIAVAVLVVLQLGFTYLPFMQALFDSTALSAGDWAILIAIGAALFVVVEIEKAVMRRRG
ncbi:MAG TPA: HAD-IC family P-type ATPase [Acidimicrobiales bacterium]|nr:HAD-IC family P-type ATPase [Acidimicrobiales bacterium]